MLVTILIAAALVAALNGLGGGVGRPRRRR